VSEVRIGYFNVSFRGNTKSTVAFWALGTRVFFLIEFPEVSEVRI
jgi:hypothetical protein